MNKRKEKEKGEKEKELPQTQSQSICCCSAAETPLGTPCDSSGPRGTSQRLLRERSRLQVEFISPEQSKMRSLGSEHP